MNKAIFSIAQTTESETPGITIQIDKRIVALDEPSGENAGLPKFATAFLAGLFVIQAVFMVLTLCRCFESVRVSVQFMKYVKVSYWHNAWPLVVLCTGSLFACLVILWIVCRQKTRAARIDMEKRQFRLDTLKFMMESVLFRHMQVQNSHNLNNRCTIKIEDITESL